MGPLEDTEIEVLAIKRARRGDPDTVRIEAVEHEDGVTICAICPSPDPDSPNVCAPAGVRSNVNNIDVSVESRIRVLAGVRFAGRTAIGDDTAGNLDADVEATSADGSIRISTAGWPAPRPPTAQSPSP